MVLGSFQNPLIDSPEASHYSLKDLPLKNILLGVQLLHSFFMPQMLGTSFNWLLKPDRESSQKFKQDNWSTIIDVERRRAIKDIADQPR